MKRLLLSIVAGAVLCLPARGAHATLSDGAADDVWGQASLSSGGCSLSATSQLTLCHPSRSAVDRQGNLWVADFFDNRVLMYPFDHATKTWSHAASVVLGQYGDMTTHGCNQPAPSGFPVAPSQYTLCGPNGLAFDRQGALFVADEMNNRILIFLHPTAPNARADAVLGQPDFTAVAPNDVPASTQCPTAGTVSACSLASPEGLTFDARGDLLAADSVNNRVLLWNMWSVLFAKARQCAAQCNVPAAQVWGQYGSFVTNCPNQQDPGNPVCQPLSSPAPTPPPTAGTLNNPEDVAVDTAGDLFIADTFNNRVLEYDRGVLTRAQNASQVYGQGGSFTTADENQGGLSASSLDLPTGVSVDGNQALWIADEGNNRVLQAGFADGPAVRVLGQPGFDTNDSSHGGIGAWSLDHPTDIMFDGAGNAFVASHGEDDRVLEYRAAP